MRWLHRITAKNFYSLADVDVRLSGLNVLVGPNGAGKSNFLGIIQFLGDTVRTDLAPAIDARGGMDAIRFRGKRKRGESANVEICIEAAVTTHSSANAPDVYDLRFDVSGGRRLWRSEAFTFKRIKGQGRRITVSGTRVEIIDGKSKQADDDMELQLDDTSSGLSTLGRLGKMKGAAQVKQLAALFETFRVFEIDARAAPRPIPIAEQSVLASDANNLAAFLKWLKDAHLEIFELLEEDLRYIAPTVRNIEFCPIGGTNRSFFVGLKECGLPGLTPLQHASFGTVRALALLAMLHDPNPPKLTCVEEIDHGLHPYALDKVVERLREATGRTQLLVATHSPALVSRLDPAELIVCERNLKSGASLIPAIDADTVARMADESELNLGELWFSGALGGVLE